MIGAQLLQRMRELLLKITASAHVHSDKREQGPLLGRFPLKVPHMIPWAHRTGGSFSEVSIPGRANMRLGGKKMCSLFSGPTDSGYEQSVHSDVGSDDEGVLSRGQVEERRPWLSQWQIL